MSPLEQLADYMRGLGHSPALKMIDGKPRLILTFSTSGNGVESVDVLAHTELPDWFTIETVYTDEHDTHRHLVACVYGIALIPVLVNEYKQIRSRT